MLKNVVKLIVSFSLCLASSYGAKTSLELASAGCESLKEILNSRDNISYEYVMMPRSYSGVENFRTQKVLIWKRVGQDNSYPPIVFLHGGVGGNSNFLFDVKGTNKLIEEYPGDFYAMDIRGEGCSKDLPSNLHPKKYRHLSVVNVARDIEYLRVRNYFKSEKIRLFGQSRGSSIIHHYFSMFPQGVESAHSHGFSIETFYKGSKGVITRAKGYLEASRRYFEEYPQDKEVIESIKSIIAEDECWTGIDNTKICGPESVGIYGISLARVGSYKGVHEGFMSMLDESGKPDLSKVRKVIGDRWLKTAYKEFNYVVGTNGLDMASIGSIGAYYLKQIGHPAYYEAPFSEVRFINEAIVKEYTTEKGTVEKMSLLDWAENYIPISYYSMYESLSKNEKQYYFLYGSRRDPIAPLSMYSSVGSFLSSLDNFVFTSLPNGHGDFEDLRVIERLMQKTY